MVYAVYQVKYCCHQIISTYPEILTKSMFAVFAIDNQLL